jgi:tetratricopeptide (TPR) repeat protein
MEVRKMKLCIALLSCGCIVLAGCAAPQKTEVQKAKEETQQTKFDQGLKALDQQDYAEAARIFDKLSLEKPGTELDLVTIYNSGAAYYAMAQCQKAADRYRQVIRSSAGKFKRIEGEALFRLSLAYECLGQDAKAIASLLDAKKRSKSLSFETASAQIPARLAAAYARMGNREKAMEYFDSASRALKVIVARGYSPTQLDTLANTMFLMGQLSPTQRNMEVDAQGFLQSLSIQQPYLLQALEMHRPNWSAKAESDLRLAYENIKRYKVDDPLQRHAFLTRGLQVAGELKKIRMPKPDSAEETIFVQVDDSERYLRNELTKVPDSTPLTNEAQRREGLKRQGRLTSPSTKKDPIDK